MRVMILTDRYAPEARAAAYLCRELAEGLVKLGHDVAVLTRMPTHFVPGSGVDAPKSAEIVAGVNVKRVSAATASSRIWLRALDQLVVSFKITLALWTAPKADVLLVYSPPLVLTLAAVFQKWIRRWPYVLNLHDLYPQTAIDLGVLRNPMLIWLAKALESLVYRNADRIVVAAPASKDILIAKNGIDKPRIETIFNYIDTTACTPGPVENAFRVRNGIQSRFVVLYAGLMGLAQDLSSMVEVAKHMKYDQSWVFILAGDGPCASKWADMTKGLSNVKMVGSLSYGEYYEALQAADVCLVFLSGAFAAPAVPGKISAIMAAGRPIIASVPNQNDTCGILDAAKCGIVVAPNRPEELLTALKALYDRPDLRGELGANGARHAASHFEAKVAIKKFELILSEACFGSYQERLVDETRNHPGIG